MSVLGACTGGVAPAPAGGAASAADPAASSVGLDAPGSTQQPSPYGSAQLALEAGTDRPVVVALDAGEQRAIGAFVRDDVVRCTGTLVAPRRVLTAAHCFAHETHLQAFDFLQRDGTERQRVPLVSVSTHPTLDLALVTLGADGLEGWADARVPVAATLEGAPALGSRVELAGAGLGSDGLRFVQLTVSTLGEASLELTAASPQGVCSGDSGGPVLRDHDGAAELVGVASTSAPNCASPAFAVRVDAASAWLAEALLAPLPPASAPCAPERDAPRCDGGAEALCRHGWWHLRDCAAEGRFCGALPGGGEGCLPTPCGSVDRHGLCDEGTAIWCGAGLETQDCAARGLGCGYSAADDGARCLACEACGGECVDLQRDPEHCGACDQRCAEAAGERCNAGRCVFPLAPTGVSSEPPPPDATVPPAGPACMAEPHRAAKNAWGLVALLAITGLLIRRPRGPQAA